MKIPLFVKMSVSCGKPLLATEQAAERIGRHGEPAPRLERAAFQAQAALPAACVKPRHRPFLPA